MIHSTSSTGHPSGVTPDHDAPASAPVPQSSLPPQARPGDSAPPGAGQGAKALARRLLSSIPRTSGSGSAGGASFARQFSATVNSNIGQIFGQRPLSGAQFGEQMSSFVNQFNTILDRAGGATPFNTDSDINGPMAHFIDQFHAALGTARHSQTDPSSHHRPLRSARAMTRGGARDASPVRHDSVQDDLDENVFAGVSVPRSAAPTDDVRSPDANRLRDSMGTPRMSQAEDPPVPSTPARPLSTVSVGSFVTARSDTANPPSTVREPHASAVPPPSHSGAQPSDNEQIAALTQRLEDMGRRFDALSEEKQTLLAQNAQLQESVRLLQEQTQLLQQQTELLRKQVAMSDKMVPEAMDHMMKSFEVFANLMKRSGEASVNITR